jgi:hypothetical protein
LHWADKQKPLQEVAGEFGVFPETIFSPPLVPEEIEAEAPVPAAKVVVREEAAPLVERVTVTEHGMVIKQTGGAPAGASRPAAFATA